MTAPVVAASCDAALKRQIGYSRSGCRWQSKEQKCFCFNAVIQERIAVLQLFTGKNQVLLVWRNPGFILNLHLYGFDGIGLINIQNDCAAAWNRYKYLEARPARIRRKTGTIPRVSPKICPMG